MRPGSSLSSAPPTSTASAFMPISCRPSRSSRMPGHRQREHALAREHARGDAAGRLELVVVDREADRAELLAELRARHRRRVGDEADAVPGVAQAAHCVDRAGDRLAGNVQHTVDVEQNRRHGRRVYSVGSRASASPGRAGRAGSTRRRARRGSRRSSTSRPRPALTRRRAAAGARAARARSCARSPRTSARSCETASSRPSGSSSRSPRRRGRAGGAGRRSRPRRRASGGSRRSAGSPS